MKSIICAVLLAVGLVSCSSCSKPTPDAVTPVTEVVASGDDWSFSFPNKNWQFANVNDASDSILNMYLNEVERNLAVFAKEPFTGTAQQFSLLAIRGLKNAGGTLISSKPITINGNAFVLIESKRASGEVMWAWLGTKNGYGYSFVCSGLDSSDSTQKALCNQIVSTLQIK